MFSKNLSDFPKNQKFISDEELEIFKLIQDNENRDQFTKMSKSLYRMDFLESRRKFYVENFGNYFPNTINALKHLFTESIKLLGLDLVANVVPAKKESGYDYQVSDAMKILKPISKIFSVNFTAKEVALKIINNIPTNNLISCLEISHPGFINIKLNDNYIFFITKNIILKNVLPPFIKKRKVVVDFSSPNIAKEMHVGHLRSTIIGESICRIFEFCKFDVLRVSHIGDWGTQFGMLIAYLEEKFPNFATEPPNIGDLQKFYKESKKKFDEDEDFKVKSHRKVVDLQTGKDENVTKAWTAICEISRRDFQRVYERLDVRVDEKGESFYQSRMNKVVEELLKKGVVEIDNKCKIIRVPGVKIPLILAKSDGAYTYDTSDIATLKYRISENEADWIIYVVDLGQREHFETLFKFARMVGWYNHNQRVEHIGFGVVLGEGKKRLKTRSGDTVKLTDLLDEGVIRSKAKLMERNMNNVYSEEELNKISEALAYSCIKYADLSHNLVTDYEFSFDRMLEDRGNTAVYLLYTYTRVRSIMRKAKKSDDDIKEYMKTNELSIEHPIEMTLLRKLIHFPEIVYRIVFETYPHFLCEYLYELCCSMSDYYDSRQILNPNGEPNMNRMAQIYAASLVLKKGFDLLGLKSLEQM